ncbi:MAG: glycosyltransferase [Saccharofermentans sp.]|nr:glycosyltransferase [Saccharofermentans sp.]
MEINDLVTVIIPSYNAAKTVVQTIESILCQTYKNLEIIIINDGSTDNSAQILSEISGKDDRIIVVNQDNEGLSAVRNKGISLAKGKWITFVDADDIIDPKLVGVLLENANKANADIAVCNYIKVNSQAECVGLFKTEVAQDDVLTSDNAISLSLLNQIPLFSWGKIYKTELFSDIAFPVGMIFEDEITTLSVFKKSSKISYTVEALYYYVMTAGSITKAPVKKHALDIIQNEEKIERLLNNENIDIKALYAHLCSGYTLAYNIVFKCDGDKELLKKLKQKNKECYQLSDRKSVDMQANSKSIVFLRLGLYKFLLRLRRVLNGNR